MTRIEFFFNVEHKLQKVADFSEKAIAKGRRLMILSENSDSTAAIEKYLWTYSALSFLPSCRADHPLATDTPVIIDHQVVNDPSSQLLHDDVLINMQCSQPPFFSRFRRLIEIVGIDEEDKAQARLRFKFYRDRGYEIRTFDASGAAL
ncbi:MAG TPA: DNA polymerase III subunit chi [Methyloradius sp.]|nr:DNA polymerase III subunit chi [Methyloradius sp.]